METQKFELYNRKSDYDKHFSKFIITTGITFIPQSENSLTNIITRLTNYSKIIEKKLFNNKFSKTITENKGQYLTFDTEICDLQEIGPNPEFSCFIEKPQTIEGYDIDLTFSTPIYVKQDIKPFVELVTQYHKDNFRIELEKDKQFMTSLNEQSQNVLAAVTKKEKKLEKIMQSIKLKC